MARQRYDIGSKWLVQNQAKETLRVGGLEKIRRVESMPGEVAQNRRYPDGLLRAFIGDDPKPRHVLIEVATFPERRALKQALDDLTLAYSALGHLPELLMLVLRPKGKYRIEGKHAVESELGLASLEVKWRIVELWTLPAERFLAEAEVGAMPWVPLMKMDGPPEAVLEQCVARIEREADPKQQGDLLAISEVMATARFPNLPLSALFKGQQIMIESPVVQRWQAESLHDAILAVLKSRFGSPGRDITKALRNIRDRDKLISLTIAAGACADLAAFTEALLSDE